MSLRLADQRGIVLNAAQQWAMPPAESHRKDVLVFSRFNVVPMRS